MKKLLLAAALLSGCANATENWGEVGIADGGSVYTSVNEIRGGSDIQMVFYLNPLDKCRLTTVMMVFANKRYDPVDEYKVVAEMKVDRLDKWSGDDTRASLDYSDGLAVAKFRTYFGTGSELFMTELSEGRELYFRWKQDGDDFSATYRFDLTGSKAFLSDAFDTCMREVGKDADVWGNETDVIW